jgi:membrane-bound serine protease (ClpP class)
VLVALGAVMVLAGLVLAARPVGAQTPSGSSATLPPQREADGSAGYVSVVTVNGLIDPILAEFMSQSITDAERTGARSLVFQADLQGSVIPDAQLGELLARIARSDVTVAVWVGPTGSELAGKAAWLAVVADEVSMAPGTSIGGAENLTAGTLTFGSASSGGIALSGPQEQRRGVIANLALLDAQQAKDAGLISIDAPTIGELFIKLPGVETKVTVDKDGKSRTEPVTVAIFNQLSILNSFMHTAASPAVAYLMISIGMALLIFELFTAGVGVAGVIGATAFILGCYGLAVLPVRWWAVVLLVLSMIAFAIDVQTGIPRFWSAAGMVLFVVATLTLYDGVSLSWITMVAGVGGIALAFFAGMPSMVRTRFSTPTIGREWMVGEMGRAVTAIDPDGVVQIKGAPWRAYTNRATPIEELDAVRVVGIEGLVLEVEPEEGGAKDYRDRSGSPKHADA